MQGLLERMALDPWGRNWLVTGSTRGHLSLWDMRFRLPVNSWQHPAGAPINALALAAAPAPRLGLRHGGGGGSAAAPLLYAAAGELVAAPAFSVSTAQSNTRAAASGASKLPR